jgi:hypothetical protein
MILGSIYGITKPWGLGWDFANFYDTGRRAAAGQLDDIYQPHSLIEGEKPLDDQEFWGTPLSAYLYVALSWFRPETALVVFKAQNTIAYFAAFVVLFLFYRRLFETPDCREWRFAALFTFLCLIYQPFWTVYRIGGQTTPTALLLLCLAMVAHADRRFVLSSLLVFAVVMIKPAFILMFVFLICVSGIQFFATAATFLLLTALASLLVGGWNIHEQFVNRMLQGLTVTYSWHVNSSLYTLVEHLRVLIQSGSDCSLLRAVFSLFFIAIKLIVVGTFVFIVLKSRGRAWSPHSRCHFNFLMGMTFFLLISQTVWDHYLAALFPLLIYVVASYKKFSPTAIGLIAGVFILSIGQNIIFIHIITHRFSFDSVPAILFACLFKSGPLILTLTFLWRCRNELLQSWTIPKKSICLAK